MADQEHISSRSQPVSALLGADFEVAWNDAPLDVVLWGIYGPDCFPTVFACKINAHTGSRAIWGFSVYDGESGFRTLGQNKAWADENELRLFASRRGAFAYISGLFDQADGALGRQDGRSPESRDEPCSSLAAPTSKEP